MANRINRFSIHMMALAIIIAIAGCGNDSQNLPPGFSTINGFQITASSPDVGASFVPLDQTIQVRFSESVDPNSLAGNLKITKTVGTKVTDVTAQAQITTSDNDSVVVISFQQGLEFNVKYKLTFLSGVSSITKKKLARTTEIAFSTGVADDGFGIGAKIKPGAPTVVSRERQIYGTPEEGGPCLGFLYRFNEDLQIVPRITVQSQRGFGAYTESSFDGDVSRAYVDSYDTYYLHIGCGCEYLLPDYYRIIEVKEAVDLEGLYMEQVDHKLFKTPAGAC